MGGAMGALGGDISTMGTNPAGIGLYRSNDVMTSFGLSLYGAPIAPPIPTNRAVPFKSFPVSLAPSYIVCAIPQGAIISGGSSSRSSSGGGSSRSSSARR